MMDEMDSFELRITNYNAHADGHSILFLCVLFVTEFK